MEAIPAHTSAGVWHVHYHRSEAMVFHCTRAPSGACSAGDNRVGIIATLFLPVVGWVAFNIGGPALNQLANTGKNANRR